MSDDQSKYNTDIEHILLNKYCGTKNGNKIESLCPIHLNEKKTDVFDFNPSKSEFYCNTCKAGGNAKDLAEFLGVTKTDKKETESD